ncbi:hypothetical protein BD309DRAFT_946801 [Dichomitus squalens]|uniref:Uncharacterized protein n=1 Tax=Dichomitus squalens TaxID=114155 RepID=A0A4Q9PAC8_9APHY|nr:hypothetical protein BD309DRAFT_946801 [Dichomitus squalens]TBU63109.1 hypothetical protein BD310DRAFT_917818 [Dichomitus squalens]
MTSWQALMALSATHTQQTKEAVESQLAERQRREAQKRKEIEEKEKRERELEAKLRIKRLEEQKREQERAERLERERQAKEREMQRRLEQERDALLYGPKKAKDKHGYPVSGAGRRRPSDDDEPGPSNVLTREEKRRRALERELGLSRSSAKRTSGGIATRKPGRRLPGGAVDSVGTISSSSSQTSPGKAQSTKERLKSEPAMLIKLNQNKRDTRTIDEIMTDRAKMRQGKVLDGESAKEFNDWFGKAKKDPPKKASVPATSSSTSRANTPAVAASGSASPRPLSSAPIKPIPKSTPASKSSAAAFAKVGSATKPPVSKAASAKPAAGVSRMPPPSHKTPLSAPAARPTPKKRRSPSSSVSPPPAKRRPAPGGSRRGDEDDVDISSQIWKIFGKDRSSYIERDVFSDDEDMEADAFDVEREEARSARIAKKEDELAMEQERRHEEEKRRKRKEKEKRGNY